MDDAGCARDGLDEVRAEMFRGCVHLVVRPSLGGGEVSVVRGRAGRTVGKVKMVDYHAAPSDIGVPFLVGPAFDQIELQVIVRRDNPVGPFPVDGLEGPFSFGQEDGIRDAEQVPFDGVEPGRGIAVVVVIAGVHQGNAFPETFGLASASFVVRVIEIGQAEGVGEFMAKGPDRGCRIQSGREPHML